MDKEYKAQLDNGTCELVDLPPGRKPSKCNYVSRFNANPGKIHWSAVKRIFRYLKGTSNFQLEFSGQKDKVANLLGYSDSDWASDVDGSHRICVYKKLFCGAMVYEGAANGRIEYHRG
ncbi:hypothetical protein JTB14_018485 [Gonioctena quinquepunctata]|nr:hypothetical protein JTB14_018485 [Gonioctena quinquepunctata]